MDQALIMANEAGLGEEILKKVGKDLLLRLQDPDYEEILKTASLIVESSNRVGAINTGFEINFLD